MAANKTQETAADVDAYLAGVEPAERKADALAARDLMQRLSGEQARLWGPSIIGFGSHHYRYDSGREGDMPLVAFSPRKAQLVVYGLGGAERYPDLMAKLGRHTTGKGCVYIKRLLDIDMVVLETLVATSLADKRRAHPDD